MIYVFTIFGILPVTSGPFLSAFCLHFFLQYVATYCILIWSVKIILIGKKMFHKK